VSKSVTTFSERKQQLQQQSAQAVTLFQLGTEFCLTEAYLRTTENTL